MAGSMFSEAGVATNSKFQLLPRLGTLPFNFDHGACTSALQKIYACFETLSDFQTCRIADNPLGPFQEIHKSIFTHDKIQIATNEG